MTVLVATNRATLPSFQELTKENIRLRRELKQMLQELRKSNENRDHIIELRNLLLHAPELLARGIRLECKHPQSKEIIRLAYPGVKLRGDTIRLGHGVERTSPKYEGVEQNLCVPFAGHIPGRWSELQYQLVPHLSALIQYYRQQRLDMHGQK